MMLLTRKKILKGYSILLLIFGVVMIYGVYSAIEAFRFCSSHIIDNDRNLQLAHDYRNLIIRFAFLLVTIWPAAIGLFCYRKWARIPAVILNLGIIILCLNDFVKIISHMYSHSAPLSFLAEHEEGHYYCPGVPELVLNLFFIVLSVVVIYLVLQKDTKLLLENKGKIEKS